MKTRLLSLLSIATATTLALTLASCCSLDAESLQESRAAEPDDTEVVNDTIPMIYSIWKVRKVNGEDYTGDPHYITIKQGEEFSDVYFRDTAVECINAGPFVVDGDRIKVTNTDFSGSPTGTEGEYVLKGISANYCTLASGDESYLMERNADVSENGLANVNKNWAFNINGNSYGYMSHGHGAAIFPQTSAKLDDGKLEYKVDCTWKTREYVGDQMDHDFTAKIACSVEDFDYNTARYGYPVNLLSGNLQLFDQIKSNPSGFDADAMTVESTEYDYMLDENNAGAITYYSHYSYSSTFMEGKDYTVLYLEGVEFSPVGAIPREGFEKLTVTGFLIIESPVRAPSGIIPVYAD